MPAKRASTSGSSVLAFDTVYDGAFHMTSTSQLYGSTVSKWATAQTYKSVFGSATPRPWQRSPSRKELEVVDIGPGRYDPHRPHHLLASSSVSWGCRGRTGPIGLPFDSKRESNSFRTGVPRGSFSTSPKVGKIHKEDAFIFNSDFNRANLMRQDFRNTLHGMSLGYGASSQPHSQFQRRFSASS